MLSRLSDLVVLSLYICSSGVYLTFRTSDCIDTIFKHCHPWLISENVGNLLIFREKVLDLRPKSVSAVKMTMYVLHWTCVSINRKDVHA